MKSELTNHLFTTHKMLRIDDAVMKKQGIEKLLDALKDREWHTVAETINRTGIEECRMKLVTSFLQEFQFIQQDKKRGKIKLTISTTEFLEKLEKTDPVSSYEEITA